MIINKMLTIQSHNINTILEKKKKKTTTILFYIYVIFFFQCSCVIKLIHKVIFIKEKIPAVD